jgi:Glycosyltransferases involved in cell wall biogenesis
MKLLTICIPTYNRSAYLISQLNFLKNEVSSFKDIIDIKVADNNSDEIHRNKAIRYHSENPFFELFLNEENLGLIGNVYYLFSLTDSKYVWFVGDDDILISGVINRIVQILNFNNSINYLFLNNNGFVNEPNNVVKRLKLGEGFGLVSKSKEYFTNIFIENGPSCMFITANVYNCAILQQIINNIKKKSIVDPLIFSFGLVDDMKVYIEKEIFVLDRYSAPSYSSQSLSIFSWEVPLSIVSLKKYGYSSVDIKKMLYSYYMNGNGNYIRMLLQSPINTKCSIIKELGFSQCYVLVKSILLNVKRIFLFLKNKI